MNQEAPFLIVGNGEYANRGCEAIAKSSIRLIREFFPGVHMINGNQGGDYDQIDETEPDVTHMSCRTFTGPFSRMWVSDQVYGRTRALLDLSSAGRFVNEWAPKCRAVLSMGGDRYGLCDSRQYLLQYLFLGEAAMNARKPFIIWGATIGQFERAPDLKKLAMRHFRKCALILVRDQASLDYLNENGVRDNVRLVADPAFLLEPEEPRVLPPMQEPIEETIGFNLVSSYGNVGGVGSYRDMIKLGADCVQEIMRATGRPVLLVPHVMAYPETTYDSDTLFLTLVREALADRGISVPQLQSTLRSWEVKWVLARMRAYVGSRWHSTVGSLSSGTPTVSIVFSEKGPALHSFLLNHTKFVLDCKDLSVASVTDKTLALLAEEQAVRDALRQRLPEIRQLARGAGQYLKECLAATAQE